MCKCEYAVEGSKLITLVSVDYIAIPYDNAARTLSVWNKTTWYTEVEQTNANTHKHDCNTSAYQRFDFMKKSCFHSDLEI